MIRANDADIDRLFAPSGSTALRRPIALAAMALGVQLWLIGDAWTGQPADLWAWLAIGAMLALQLDLVTLYRRLRRGGDRREAQLLADLKGLHAALDQHSIVSITDRHGTILHANDRFCQISHYSREELRGQDHRLINSRHHPPAFFRQMWRTISRGNVWHGEVCNRAKDGSIYWVDTVIVPICDAAGQISRYVSIRYDITERKRSSELLQQAIETIPDGFAIFDPDDRLVVFNTAYRAWYEQMGARMAPGQRFEDLVRGIVATGQFPDAGDTEASRSRWLRRRMQLHRRASGEFFVQRLANDRWLRICESRTPAGYVVGFRVDISMLKRAEAALTDSQHKLRGLFELSPLGIALLDRDSGRLIEFNDALVHILGRRPSELRQMRAIDLVRPRCRRAVLSASKALGRSGRYGPLEVELLTQSGDPCTVLLSSLRTADHDGRSHIWTIVQDITARKDVEDRLSRAAFVDELTGLANRNRFTERLSRALQRVRSAQASPFALLFLDFDRFKYVNDSFGHAAGDQLLREMARRIQGVLQQIEPALPDPPDDDDAASRSGPPRRNVAARFGGDEFVMLMTDVHDADSAIAVADRILAAVAPPFSIEGYEFHPSVSVGIVMGGPDSVSADALLRDADIAMYEAKRAGRGRAVVFDDGMRRAIARKVEIEAGLRRAIGEHQLSLVYQPIVSLDDGRMVAVEALLRWHHPTLGWVPPEEFVPIAEDSGSILEIGEWVLLQACRQWCLWQRQDPLRAPASVSVNISRSQLNFPVQILKMLSRAIAQTGIPPQALQLEITEREVMGDSRAFEPLSRQIRDLGVQLALDDFGTGVSSLGQLRTLAVQTVKIDRSFIAGIESDPDLITLVHATVALVNNLGKTSVAEGVETQAQAAVLASMGCRHAQGYYFCRPVPPDQVLAYRMPGAAQAQAQVATLP